MVAHTVTAFDFELDELKHLVQVMGRLAGRQLRGAIAALTRDGCEAVGKIVAQDKVIDKIQREIETKAIGLIATRQPFAIDLRLAVSALRVAADLERIGDLATNIAKRTLALKGTSYFRESMGDIVRLGEMSLAPLRATLKAIDRQNGEDALHTLTACENVTDCYDLALSKLLKAMLIEPAGIVAGAHLSFCMRNIEQIGSHTKSIVAMVYYAIEGRSLMSLRVKSGLAISSDISSRTPVADGAAATLTIPASGGTLIRGTLR